MSYLDTLLRANENPITDYHSYLLQNSLKNDIVVAFFGNTEITRILDKIAEIELELSKIEKTHSSEEKKEQLIEQRTELHSEYEKIKKATAFPMPINDQSVKTQRKMEFEDTSITNNQKDNQTILSGRDFLLSIAGTFDLDTPEDYEADVSENVKRYVQEMVSKKHGIENDIIITDPALRGGRPIIAGTGTTVRNLAIMYKQGLTPEEIMADLPSITSLAQVYAALIYYHLNIQEIEADIEADSEENLIAKYGSTINTIHA